MELAPLSKFGIGFGMVSTEPGGEYANLVREHLERLKTIPKVDFSDNPYPREFSNSFL